ncbi:MAG: heme-binding domain-containing protein [Myxococcaceae bacterium]
MKRPVKVVLGVVAVLVLIQLLRPSHENPPVTGEITVPADVKAVLKRSCYDCHSNETVWPWYSNVAPISWLVARDVDEGREHLNFSEFASYEPGRAKKKLEEIELEVAGDEMPMAIYLPMHPDAKLSEADKKLIVDWAKQR